MMLTADSFGIKEWLGLGSIKATKIKSIIENDEILFYLKQTKANGF